VQACRPPATESPVATTPEPLPESLPEEVLPTEAIPENEHSEVTENNQLEPIGSAAGPMILIPRERPATATAAVSHAPLAMATEGAL
jgi:hypothetical protein